MTAKELKASILDLAIRGKLVPQDPNDEPAEKLLARIAAEKAKLVKSGKLKKEKPLPPITDDDKPFDLPRSWAWCRLGEITPEFTYGTASKSQKVGKVPVLRMGNLQNGEIDYSDLVYTSSEDDIAKYHLEKFDLLFNRTNSADKVGKVSIYRATIPAIYAGYLVRFRPEGVNLEFVNYVMNSAYAYDFCQTVKSDAIGQSNISASKLRNFLLPLPPLAEQKRIVEKIEQLMPLVERYGQAEEKRRQLIATLPEALKKSILKSAFDTGFNADCVFEEKTLEDVCADVFTGNSLSDAEKRMFTTDKGLPFIGTKDVGFDQVVDYDNGIRIPASENKYRTAAAGSTLLCVEGGSSGRKIAILDQDVRFGNKLCAFVPSKKVDVHYLFLFLQSPQFLEQFAALQNGPRKGAGVSQVKKLMIRYVPLAEQKRIAAKVEELFKIVDSIKK